MLERAGSFEYYHQIGGIAMQAFLQHVGHQNQQHLADTVTTLRTIDELRLAIPPAAVERSFFDRSGQLGNAFPNGVFNCWGLMARAEARFKELQVGDLVLMVPHIGIHGGGVQQLGVVKLKCPVRCYEASRLLWPNIEDTSKLYPFLFFFDTELGFRNWYRFLEDLGYDEKFNPRGYFLRIDPDRFDRWGGVEGYLAFLRSNCDFKPLVAGGLSQPLTQHTDELEQIRAEKEQEGAFSPSDLEDARKRVLASIVLRQGQSAFREKLLAAYLRSCAVTGCDVVQALEAAHIVPFFGPLTNKVNNGLLLRGDIHTLFDLGLMAIDPNDYRVLVSKRLKGSCYESFAGQVILLPVDKGHYPSRKALKMRLAEFQTREGSQRAGLCSSERDSS
jgi:hypothetical protein